MDTTELCYTPATDLARLVRERQISPVEIVDAYLARIAEFNPALLAYCTVAAEQARQAAQQAEKAVQPGAALGPLHGLPVAVKDLTPTAGIRTTYASHIFADNVPGEDAALVQRLKQAGAIILGKTNTPEFGAGANTFNTLFGITRNPWDTRLTPAGSSGGSAAALAAGLCALATGSDLGGSLRTPASFCGVVGFRPSPSRVPQYPVALPWEPLAVSGPMARTVAEVALMLSVMAGQDDRAPLSIASDPVEFTAAVEKPTIAGWRVAWSADLGFAPVEAEVARLARQAAEVFATDLGCTLQEASPDLHDAPAIFQTIRAAHMTTLAEHLPRWRDKMQPNLVWNIEKGLNLSASDLTSAEVARGRLCQRAINFFNGYDLLVTPAAATLPFPVEVISPPVIGQRPMENYVEWLGLAYGITLTGLPAIAVPAGLSESGLPVGLQLVGRPRGEAALLRAAAAFEQARPWSHLRPAL